MLNRTHLPDAIKIRSYRVAAIAWAVLFFGTLAALTIWAQLATLRS
jgi:hypothetical protein